MKFTDFLNEVKLYRGGVIPSGKTLVWYTEDPDFASTYSHLKGDFVFHEVDADLSKYNVCDIGRIENVTSMIYLCGVLWFINKSVCYRFIFCCFNAIYF
jgi:adenylate cyclase